MSPNSDARLAVLEERSKRQDKVLDELVLEVRGVARDMHAAKVSGRLFLGVALALAGFLGWLAGMMKG